MSSDEEADQADDTVIGKNFLVELIKNHAASVSFINIDDMRSDVYSYYQYALKNKKKTGFITCKKCVKVFKLKTEDGTAGLKKHTCVKLNNSKKLKTGQPSIDGKFYKIPTTEM